MIQCPNCGSKIKLISVRASGDEFLVVKRDYNCDCGEIFHTVQYYDAQSKEVEYKI